MNSPMTSSCFTADRLDYDLRFSGNQISLDYFYQATGKESGVDF
ncbi:MAG: hypothetical protein OXC40_00620 [Proteobacteria bacterium]|nr:hypothetical protein [Pseudomonadota bacterium]